MTFWEYNHSLCKCVLLNVEADQRSLLQSFKKKAHVSFDVLHIDREIMLHLELNNTLFQCKVIDNWFTELNLKSFNKVVWRMSHLSSRNLEQQVATDQKQIDVLV